MYRLEAFFPQALPGALEELFAVLPAEVVDDLFDRLGMVFRGHQQGVRRVHDDEAVDPDQRDDLPRRPGVVVAGADRDLRVGGPVVGALDDGGEAPPATDVVPANVGRDDGDVLRLLQDTVVDPPAAGLFPDLRAHAFVAGRAFGVGEGLPRLRRVAPVR